MCVCLLMHMLTYININTYYRNIHVKRNVNLLTLLTYSFTLTTKNCALLMTMLFYRAFETLS